MHLVVSYIKDFKEDKLKIEGGIVLDNLFEDRVKDESLVNWPNESGIVPTKLLSLSQNASRGDRFPKESGILPIRLLS